MKEKLLMTRMSLCDPPPVAHSLTTCLPNHRGACNKAWQDFWRYEIAPKLLDTTDTAENQLTWIHREIVAKANVKDIDGMRGACLTSTLKFLSQHDGWMAELHIPEGAVELLMVPERLMLSPDIE